MHTTAMTMMSSIGQSGSAIFPFVIGLISNKKGIWTVQPAVVALLVGQFSCWNLVPRVARRVEWRARDCEEGQLRRQKRKYNFWMVYFCYWYRPSGSDQEGRGGGNENRGSQISYLVSHPQNIHFPDFIPLKKCKKIVDQCKYFS